MHIYYGGSIYCMPLMVIELYSLPVVNKKGTKFVSARKTIPNVNLRGLEPSDIRNAQSEFRKFDMENNGWVDKAVLFPLMKACFANSMNEREIKTLLASTSLMSLVCLFVGQITVDL